MCSCTLPCYKWIVIFFIVIAFIRTTYGESHGNETDIFRAGNECPINIETLDFIRNFSVPNLDFDWPCESRIYWVSLKPFVRFVRFLLNDVTPVVIIIGVSLNVVSYVMLGTLTMSDSSLALYLRALALSDNGALIFNFGVDIMRSKSSYVNSLYRNSRFLCKFNSVAMELFQFTSTWLVVCLTWARVAAVIFPLRNHKCNNRSPVFTIAVISCISMTLALTKLNYSGYESDSVFEFEPCQKKSKPWGSAMYFYIAFSTWLPSLFILIGNVLLMIHVKKSEKIRNRLTRTINHTNPRTSRVLMVVSMVYLVLLLPIGIIETLELYWDVFLVKKPSINNSENELYINWLKEKMLLKWCRGLLFHIYHWNFAINFFLYYLAGKTFRDGVIKALKNSADDVKKFATSLFRCNSCTKIFTVMTRPRRSNILLISVISVGEQTVNGNLSSHNSNGFRDGNK